MGISGHNQPSGELHGLNECGLSGHYEILPRPLDLWFLQNLTINQQIQKKIAIWWKGETILLEKAHSNIPFFKYYEHNDFVYELVWLL